MDDMYREQILEHSKHPHNFGTLEAPSVSREEFNPLCGDRVRLDLQIADGVITDVRFSGRGCAISQASASLLTDELRGMTVEAAKVYRKEDLLELIGIPLAKNPVRLKCALLSLKALKAGLYGVGHIHDDDEEE
ncbi:NifU family SUF system FeS assembly protein [Oscillochloris trichoides DG-6]|uniref:NifU family SUF system FeS assembly protein n=1 Tax=Oscillochloris trichoides DG-6 TaxID=765420 RepID=E1IDT7_9CHLR|nr:SUF system NifU family Fe-S cluster assembly protein [Oscillochloris trichoides]EFO80658.1 NifU family SUF system FeS assembly protein [Oscillochloris trichoides DG-6]